MRDEHPKLTGQDLRLFTVSFVMLFLEIALIRWVSAEIRIFTYLNNLVLLACFLGIGLGSYFARSRTHLFITPTVLASLILLVFGPLQIQWGNASLHIVRDIPTLLSAFTDSVIWDEAAGVSPRAVAAGVVLGMVLTFVIFSFALLMFVPLGQILGRLLAEHPNPIRGYSINVSASILGVVSFAVLSFLYVPSWAWFLIVAAILPFCASRSWKTYAAIAAMCVTITFAMILPGYRGPVRTIWSPFHKLDVTPRPGKGRGYKIVANRSAFMLVLNLSDEFLKQHLEIFGNAQRRFTQYDLPYYFKSDANDVLIVGAGAGNDAAGSLRHGVQHVDAVEIDPGICLLGRSLHPEKPYFDTRVNLIVDDARAFFNRTRNKYDIISFGALAGDPLGSSYNNMRLDHYAYTVKSLLEAKDLLNENGILTLLFGVQRPWIGFRIARLLENAFGHPPLIFKVHVGPYPELGWGGTMYVTGRNREMLAELLRSDPDLQEFVRANQVSWEGDVQLTTDDWPYLYLEKRRIPKMHLCVILVLVGMLVLASRPILSRRKSLNLHFFFLGAAFLLLEFVNISRGALLFGAGWIASTFVISVILLLILCANLFVSRVRIRSIKWVGLALVLSLLGAYFIPLQWFNFLSYWPGSLVASLFLNLPVFFGGILFIHFFKDSPAKNDAFGANLMGAAAGGLLESLSFVVGIKAILLVVLVLYGLSMLVSRRAAAWGAK